LIRPAITIKQSVNGFRDVKDQIEEVGGVYVFLFILTSFILTLFGPLFCILIGILIACLLALYSKD
jgi:hypothetical protein